MKRNTLGIILLIIGGICMLISFAVGSIGLYEFLYDIVINEVPTSLQPVLTVILEIIRWIADLGGGAIILGAILIMFKVYRLGKWIISIGLTFGTLALIVWLISKIVDVTGIITDVTILGYLDNLEGFFTYNSGLQFIGVVICILGRNFVKKPKKKKEVEVEEEEEVDEIAASEEPQQVDEFAPPPISSKNKFCPKCGTKLPANVSYCTECGATFDR
jgi:hypothetical protein